MSSANATSHAAQEVDTRTRLLETALNLMWANSYNGVSVDEICEAAECKKGSFYHFFQSKADLAILALERAWDGLKLDLDRIFSPSVAPLDRLKNYVEYSQKLQREIRESLSYVPGCPFATLGCEQCSENDGLREKANDVLLRFRKYFESAIREAIDDGTLPSKDYKQLAEILYLYYTGVNTQARLANSMEPFENLWPAWKQILFSEKV